MQEEAPLAGRAVLVAVCIAALGVAPTPAGAANIDVDTTADQSVDNAFCSLREAVKSANLNSNAHEPDCEQGDAGIDDSVDLDAGTYTLTGASGEESNATGDLDLTPASGVVTINGIKNGNDVPLTIMDGANADRLIDVQPDAVNTSAIKVQNVILRNGNVTAVPGMTADRLDGGAIRIRDDDSQFEISTSRVLDSDAGRFGGGLSFDEGAGGPDLKITQTVFAANVAANDGGGVFYDGPPAFPVSVVRSAFAGNRTGDLGGGIFIEEQAGTPMQIINSTLSDNTAANGGGGAALGNGGLFEFLHSTIASNVTTAGAGGGVLANAPNEEAQFTATIISGNTAGGAASNCGGGGTFTDFGGFNLESANSCSLITATPSLSLINTDPLLAPLAFNLAPVNGLLTTPTRGLYDGSPALNRIPRTPADACANANDVDQRGEPRPPGPAGLCDVGAFEGSVGPKPPELALAGASVPTSSTPAKKKCKKKHKKKRAAAAKKKCRKKKR